MLSQHLFEQLQQRWGCTINRFADHLNSRLSRFTLPVDEFELGIRTGSMVVFKHERDRFRNVTSGYLATIGERPVATPKRILIGLPFFAYLLSKDWYNVEEGYRWMPKTAELLIGGPSNAEEKLNVRGFCGAAQLRDGPIRLSIEVNKVAMPDTQINDCAQSFQLKFPLAAFTGQAQLRVVFRVNKTNRIDPDVRELGIAMEEVRVQ